MHLPLPPPLPLSKQAVIEQCTSPNIYLAVVTYFVDKYVIAVIAKATVDMIPPMKLSDSWKPSTRPSCMERGFTSCNNNRIEAMHMD
jgi:hypothetical protein